jgi:hypothetical protein
MWLGWGYKEYIQSFGGENFLGNIHLADHEGDGRITTVILWRQVIKIEVGLN